MKDEIKEIIQLIGSCYYHGEISEDKCKKYCNYITNLQEDLDYQKQAEQEYNEKHTKLMRKYKKLYKKLQQEKKDFKETNDYCFELLDYKSRIDKAVEYIKENTRWFDSEYAKVYGELCDCAGAKGGRLEVLVNPSNLSKILGGDKDVKDKR